jgi:hypothetical protein
MDPPNRLVVMRRAPVAPARPSSAAFAWAGDRRPLASLIQPVNGAGSEGERAPAARLRESPYLGIRHIGQKAAPPGSRTSLLTSKPCLR